MPASLRFGTDELALPRRAEGLPVLAGTEPAALPDPLRELARVLCAPLSGPPLAEFAAGCRKLALILPDGTRPLPTALVEGVLEALGKAPTIVRIANGTHRRTTEDEHRRLLGRFYGKVEVGDRAADDPAAHVALPGGAASPPARSIDRLAADCDGLVLMGPSSFHYLAGFGGGGKLLAPGLADRATADYVHSACLAPQGGRHPDARLGVLDSPLRRRLEEVCRCAPRQFYVIPQLDSQYRPVALFAGERQATLRAACEALTRSNGVPCRRYRTIIACAGGHPYDVDFVQAHKAWEAAMAACVPGGNIVWIARCPEGLPARHLAFLEKHRTAAQMESALRARFDIAAHTVWAARLKAEGSRVVALTQLGEPIVSALGMSKAASLEQALGEVPLDDAAILPLGSRFLPIAS